MHFMFIQICYSKYLHLYLGNGPIKRIPLGYHGNMTSLWFNILKVKTIRIKLIPHYVIEIFYRFLVIVDFNEVL